MLSAAQMAAHVKEHGGGSFSWGEHEEPEGPGYMVGVEGGEQKLSGKITPEKIEKFKAENEPLATAQDHRAYLGFWGARPTTADVSVKATTGEEARKIGIDNKQEAVYALPKTEVRPGVLVEQLNGSGEYGSDILLHTRNLGATETDPNYRTPENPNHFSNYEVSNPDWDKVMGTTRHRFNHSIGHRDPSLPPLKRSVPMTLGAHLRWQNYLRAQELRGQGEQ